jgi:glycosyltransferase involved in cell wall biosynthesis
MLLSPRALQQHRSTVSHFANVRCEVKRLRHPGPITDADLPDADVVIATWWETVEWLMPLSPRKGTKVHFMQDYETWGGPVARVDAVYAIPLPRIVIARWEVDLLRERWGQSPIDCIPNGVDRGLFFAPPRGKRPVPTVGVVYTSFRNKGCDVSFAAVECARREIPSLHLVAFGTQPSLRELPILPQTEFHLDVPDDELRTIYARCDAWLFGTRKEGFGLPILEAMACRTPVIGTPAGAAPDLLAQGGGFLVGHEDVAGMAESIVRVARLDEQPWRDLSDRALETATRCSWDDAADRFEDALARARAAETAGAPAAVAH